MDTSNLIIFNQKKDGFYQKSHQERVVLLLTIGVAFLTFFWVIIKQPEPGALLLDVNVGGQLAGANQMLAGEHPFIDF